MKRRGAAGDAPATRSGGSERRPRGEAGQSLVLFALAMLTMLAMLSLVVDTGNLYFQRRKAQQAADVAALAGAINSQGLMPNVTLKPAEAVRDARRMTITNGFTTSEGAANGEKNGEVTVHVPPATGPFAGQADYIEVVIERQVPVLFGRVLGYDQFTIGARAVARAKHLAFDAATISFNEGSQSTKINGNADGEIRGNAYSRGGIHSPSAASDLVIYGAAFARHGTQGDVATDPPGNVVTGTDSVPYLQVPDYDPPPYTVQNPAQSWNNNIGVPKGQVNVFITPGTYQDIDIRPNKPPVVFCSGVYVITGTVKINGEATSWPLGQMMPDGVTQCGGPVTFVLVGSSAGFDIQAQAEVSFESGHDASHPYNRFIIYHTATSGCGTALKITGGASVRFKGTIFAPCGEIRLAGNSDGMVRGQVLADTITFVGGSGPGVIYDKDYVAEIPGPGLVE